MQLKITRKINRSNSLVVNHHLITKSFRKRIRARKPKLKTNNTQQDQRNKEGKPPVRIRKPKLMRTQKEMITSNLSQSMKRKDGKHRGKDNSKSKAIKGSTKIPYQSKLQDHKRLVKPYKLKHKPNQE